jgi:hypothetical protein
MIVKKHKPIKFINTCGCIVDEKELEQAILWYTDKPVCGTKKIFMHGNYPAVAIYKEKIHVHRLLMMYWQNRKLLRNEYVHHIDENKLNAMKSNLCLIEVGKHQSMHNKGKVFSENHRALISEANRRRAGRIKFKKRVHIDLVELQKMASSGASISSMARYFKCDRWTIKNRLYENPELLKGDGNA